MAQLNFGTGNSVGFGTTSGGSATASFDKSNLSNIQIGDLLVAWIHNQAPDVGNTITAPSGWTRYGAALGTPSYSASRLSGFYYYPIKTQADINALPTTITWTFSTANGRVACIVSRATGINLDHIEDVSSSAFTVSSASTSFTIPGLTTNNPTTLVVGGAAHQNSAGTGAPTTTGFMSAFQEYKTTGGSEANTGSALGYQEQSTAGSTGDITATFDLQMTNAIGEIVVFTTGTYQAPGTITRPVIVGTPTTTLLQSASTSFTINVPTGLQDGDALIMAVSAQTPTQTTDFASSGWSRISQPFIASSSGYRDVAFYAYSVPRAVLMTSTSFTFTSTDSASGGRIVAEMFIVRGADLSNLVTSTSSAYGTSAARVLTVNPGTPTVNYNLLLVAYNAQFTGSIDYSIASGPAGMTQQANMTSTTTTTSSKTTLTVYQQNVESGPITPKQLTWNAANSQNSGTAITLRGLSAAVTNNGIALQYTSSTDVLSNAHLFYTSATDTLATPLEVRPVPQGYSSVTNMLATNPIYVAHRGGSGNWPEMSLYAYTQSVFWGVKAIEVSLARTSDGVWFGLHDATLDRTSGTTNFIAANHTWAEVQQYSITAASTTDTTQPARPYMRWEELMAAYYTSHVIFVDPKVASAYTTELLSMMDAMPGTPTDRFVAKYYGPTTSWGNQAHAHGYKTWGYYYQADVPTLATTQASWDILGMDYTADQASWTAVMSYGKPVLGHIVSTAAGATTAFNYGAQGVMVSGVIATIPRSS